MQRHRRYNKVLDELVRFIKNYMKSEPTILTWEFVVKEGKNIPRL